MTAWVGSRRVVYAGARRTVQVQTRKGVEVEARQAAEAGMLALTEGPDQGASASERHYTPRHRLRIGPQKIGVTWKRFFRIRTADLDGTKHPSQSTGLCRSFCAPFHLFSSSSPSTPA